MDSEPAFSRPCFDNGEWSNDAQKGMSLHDYFVGQALIGIVNRYLSAENDGSTDENLASVDCAVDMAFVFADEVMRIRKERGT